MLKKAIAIVSVILFLGCTKNTKEAAVVYDVPAEFQGIVSSFVSEAAQRGNTLKINNLIIKYDSTLDNSYCAACNSTSLDPSVQKIILVNPNNHCYHYAQEKEALFFHELGHCILGRVHTDKLLPNGDPKSIMVKDNIHIYSYCVYPIGGTCNDNSFKRSYYLDELFNEQTPVPAWGE